MIKAALRKLLGVLAALLELPTAYYAEFAILLQAKSDGYISQSLAHETEMLQVDKLGFDAMDRFQTLIDKFQGGPVGIESLAAALGEDRGTLEEVLEPYLIQEGYVIRTPRGRVASASAYQHFGLIKNQA